MTFKEKYDLVIANGRVTESGIDGIRHVAVRSDKIVAISEQPLVGNTLIDASGEVVAPGFIDPHSHGANDPFSGKVGVIDGKTTQLDLEFGAWPVNRWYDRMEGRAE